MKPHVKEILKRALDNYTNTPACGKFEVMVRVVRSLKRYDQGLPPYAAISPDVVQALRIFSRIYRNTLLHNCASFGMDFDFYTHGLSAQN